MGDSSPSTPPPPRNLITPKISRSKSRLEFLEKIVRDEHKIILQQFRKDELIEVPPLEGFKQLVSDLEFADAVADLSNENEKITKTLVLDAETSNLRDVAVNWSDDRLLDLFRAHPAGETKENLANHSPQLRRSASVHRRTKDPSDLRHIVTRFQRKLFQAEASGFTVRMLRDGVLRLDPEVASEEGARDREPQVLAAVTSQTGSSSVASPVKVPLAHKVADVLQLKKTFDIRKDNINSLLTDPKTEAALSEEDKPLVKTSLRRLQAAQLLSPVPEALPALFNAQMSAFRVAQIPRNAFLARFSGVVGGDAVAVQIHNHAMQVAARNDLALVQTLQAVRGTGLAAIDGRETKQDRLRRLTRDASRLPEQINLEKLFGNMDFCACDDCNSVLSPAAYFVELLQYLRNNNLHPEKDGTKSDALGIRNTPLEKLFRRRPDLACLELTCANTTTVLPYIDLANEVMESFIVHLKRFVDSNHAYIDVWNASDQQEGLGGSTAELVASPQNTNLTAYCILSKSVYPPTKLPYNQAIDAIRQYLEFLGTSRAELVEVFQGSYTPPTKTCSDVWSAEHSYGDVDDTDDNIPRTWSPSSDCSSSCPEDSDGSDLDYIDAGDDANCEFTSTSLSGEHRERLRSIHQEAIARATHAEQILVTEEEYITLTKEAFWPKAHFDIRHGKNDTSLEAYRRRIGLRQAWEYWGLDYKSVDDMLDLDEARQSGLAFVKRQFLPRASIKYEELVDLVKTNFVNPRMLRGRAKVVMESIQFSYRFLAKLVDSKQKHAKLRLQKIIDFLEDPSKNEQTVRELLQAERCRERCCDALWQYLTADRQFLAQDLTTEAVVTRESPGHCKTCLNKGSWCSCRLRKELRRWICEHFESCGKIIVLDNGEGPRLPWTADVILHWQEPSTPRLTRLRGSAEASSTFEAAMSPPAAGAQAAVSSGNKDDVVLGRLQPDGKILKPAPSEELLATVSISGEVAFLDGTPFMEPYKSDAQQEVRLKRNDIETGKRWDGEILRKDSMISMDGVGIGNKAWTPVTDDCDLTKVRLTHLDGSPVDDAEFDRMHRFLRLWRKLGWTMVELDAALRAFGVRALPQQPAAKDTGRPAGEGIDDEDNDDVDFDDYLYSCRDGNCGRRRCRDCRVRSHDDVSEKLRSQKHRPCRGDNVSNCKCGVCQKDRKQKIPPPEITPYLLHQVALLQKLVTVTGLPLLKLLTFWVPIDVYSTPSLYAQLFLTHNILGIDRVFAADDGGNYLAQAEGSRPKIQDHLMVIRSALQVDAEGLQAIMKVSNLKPDADLTLESISMIYRHTLIAKILSVKPRDLWLVFDLFHSPWSSAQHALDLVEIVKKVTASGFTVKQLSYVLKNHDDPLQPMAPSPRKILQISSTLYSSLEGIRTQHPDITTAEAATNDAVQGKAQLIFSAEMVSKIVAFLEGSSPYSTNAPQLDKVDIPEGLRLKIKYIASPKPTLQATGQLTLEEAELAKALFPRNLKWHAAIDRLPRQAASFFRTALAGIFEDETRAKESLLTGDRPAPLDPQAENQATAPAKRLFFLQSFIPFLRRRLADKTVIDNFSSAVSLPADITADLMQDILVFQDGTPTQQRISARTVIERSAVNQNRDQKGWSGYLIPPSTNRYTFYAPSVADDSQPKSMLVDGQPYVFTEQQEDPTDVWFGRPIKLNGGQLYEIALQDQPATDLSWATDMLPASSVPRTSLLPGHASDSIKSILSALAKISILIQGFGLSREEVGFLQSHGEDFGEFDLNSLNVQSWERIADYVKLRNSLTKTSTTLLDTMIWAHNALSVDDSNKVAISTAEMPMRIAALTLWDVEDVRSLIATTHFDFHNLGALKNERALSKMQKAIDIVKKITVKPNKLFRWSRPRTNFQESLIVAEDVRKAIRAKYSLSDWEKAIKPTYDKLRQNQSDALVAFLVTQPHMVEQGIFDADSLFEFFLIDPSMCPCMETSRLKQATSSVQLFVQRCLLGLEDQTRGFGQGVAVGDLDRERWGWMQRYRVWEANRKVYLYPENWIQSSLRDDKSPQYFALESELLQKDVSEKNIIEALKHYLFSLDEVANLESTAIYVEAEMKTNNGSGAADEEPIRATKKIHFFAKTRQAPSKHFYRHYDRYLKTWSSWQHMQIDVPSYEIDRSINAAGKNLSGTYVVPFMYNGRLLVALPQFMKKQITKDLPDKSFADMGKPSDEDNLKAADLMPEEYWEIRLGLTELLSGQWKQKVISNDAITTTSVVPKSLPEISEFQFVPLVPKLRLPGAGSTQGPAAPDASEPLYVVVQQGSSTEIGRFSFTGNVIMRDAKGPFSQAPAVSKVFQSSANGSTMTMSSLQVEGKESNALLYPRQPNVSYTTSAQPTSKVDLESNFTCDFYDELGHELLSKVSMTGNLDSLFGYFHERITTQAQKDNAYGAKIFNADPADAQFKTYNELYRPYSLHYWEAGFHAPMALADRCLQTNQFDLALKMCHYVFNPYANGSQENRWWLWPPFKEVDAVNSMEKLFADLMPGKSVAIDHQINQWRDNPFQPHVLARLRPVAYMKWVVMKYIEILIAYGDYYFKQNTLEMIPMAIQMYVLASHVYGPRGQRIPKRGKKKAETYLSLVDKFDAFDNAMVELELLFPFSNQIEQPWGESNNVRGLANVFGFATSRYFCIPQNPDLVALRDKIDDRLFKIRHCKDIDGKDRRLPLYEPPIDPGLLVAAVAQGLSLDSVLADLNAPMPNYRFSYLLGKAQELCAELKSLTGAFLSAKEKQDGEAMAILRQRHDTSIQELVMSQKKLALEEAAKTLEALTYSKERPTHQLKHTLKQLGEDLNRIPKEEDEWKELETVIERPLLESGLKLIQGEIEEFEKSEAAHILSKGSSTIQTIASQLHILPTINLHASVFGVGPAVCFGPPNIAEGMGAISSVMRIFADGKTHESQAAARRVSSVRQGQDRSLTANTTAYDIKNIDRQIFTQRVKINMCNADIRTQEKQIANVQEITDFMSNKYSNTELYTFMEGTTRVLCYQAYQMAYEWAKKAEKAFRFERGLSDTDPAPFIEFGYWQPTRDGLLSGEKLALALKRLEAAYNDSRGYDYEITKHVSLRQVNPLTLLKLRETGRCEFSIAEVLFDMDFPGHYQRKLKSVAITIPCIVGPYTTMNCTLRLLSHKYRTSSITRDKRDYLEKTDNPSEPDPRFSTVNVPINAIAVSSGQNDSGVFELNFKDERYLPFEGAGAVSTWSLQFPAGFRQFDYGTITDVLVHLKYTSKEGGSILKEAASGAVDDYVTSVAELSESDGLYSIIDVKAEYSNDWAKFRKPRVRPPPTADVELPRRVLQLERVNEKLPIYTKGKEPHKLVASNVWILIDTQAVDAAKITLNDGTNDLSFTEAPGLAGPGLKAFVAQGPCFIGEWEIELTDLQVEIGKFWLLARYTMKH